MAEVGGEWGHHPARLRRATIDAAGGAERPVLLIDGGSGAGKTSLAAAVAEHWPEAAVLHLDDWTPGWDGLAAAAEALVTEVLGAASSYRAWDWGVGAPGQVVEVPRRVPLIIEGCGALQRASRARATYGVWVELDEATRRERALARDGEMFAPHWERWARQEREFRCRERPEHIADEVIGPDER